MLSVSKAIAEVSVMVVGDVMLDRFTHGVVERVSPEAPVPVFRQKEAKTMLGGAANVAVNIWSLGGTAHLIGCIGDDTQGDDILRIIKGHDGIVPSLLKSGEHTTTEKNRIVAGNQQLLRVDREIPFVYDDISRVKFLAQCRSALDHVDTLVLSDYKKGVLTADICAALIAMAHEKGIPVVVDPKTQDYSVYSGADIITPNQKELAEASGISVDTDEAIVAAARRILQDHDIGTVMATRGERGISVVTAEDVHHLPARVKEVFDVSGAGDTVVATIACCLGAGFANARRIAEIANLAAGIVVGKFGTAFVTADELDAAMLAEHHSPEHDMPSLDLVEHWKQVGQRVGFTNGCFDILHAGHISLLQAARKHCDRLVVGLNGDASVRRLKGAERPINLCRDRAALLAELKSVDLVIPFEEDTPENLIKSVRPNVLIKGADYAIEDIAGADFVIELGGEVIRIELVSGKSTTGIVSRIRATG